MSWLQWGLFCLVLIIGTHARPVFKPFAGHERFRAHSSAYQKNGVHADSFNVKVGDSYLNLQYEAERQNEVRIIFLDEELDIENIICASEKMELVARSSEAAMELSEKLTKTTLLAGGPEWGCVEPSKGASILRRVDDVMVSGNVIHLATSAAHHADFFKNAKISFSTNKVPVTSSVPISKTRNAHSRNQPRGFFSDFFSSVWNDITTVADDVAEAVDAVTTAVEFLSTGDFDYNNTFLEESLDWNYDEDGESQPITLDEYVTCSQCFGRFNFGVKFAIAIQQYQLLDLQLIAEGALEVNIQGDVAASGQWTYSNSMPITTLQWPSITFFVAAIPFNLNLAAPVSASWRLETSANVSASVAANAVGSLAFGMVYNGSAATPINSHSYSHDGSINSLNIEDHTDLQVALEITPVVQVDYVGYINFGLKPYLEASMDIGTDNVCSNSSGGIGISAALNWGIEVTVGANITIPDVWAATLGPDALVHVKKPITAGCITSSLPELAKGMAPNIDESVMVLGSTWHGWEIGQGYCDDGYWPNANVSFQLIRVNGYDSFTFVVSNNMIMEDGTWCLLQVLYDVSVDNSQTTIQMTPESDGEYAVGYSLCENSNYRWVATTKVGVLAGNYNPWDVIVVKTLDGCAQLTMLREYAS